MSKEEGGKGALVVTGGARGIGAQIARDAASLGYPVALLYHNSAREAERLVDEITAHGGTVVAIRADLGVEKEVVSAFNVVDAELGPICALVNNAVEAGSPTALALVDPIHVETVFRVNLVGTLLCVREAVARMSTSVGGAGGTIVSLSSQRAVRTGGGGGWLAFAASKAAIESVSHGLAIDLAAEGIRVNVVRVGIVDTERRRTQPREYVAELLAGVPMRRIGLPTEVSAAVLWLSSPESSYVAGATIEVAGGL